MKLFALFLLLLSQTAVALEVDEKLTVRILSTSETRKTLMVNRGTEDGLVEGDHARFIVTAGIVARAVCIKVSPTRSVWSVYRLVNADFIVTDAVMTLKITPPVKITRDETQAIVREDTPRKLPTDPEALGIPLADGARDLENLTDDRIDESELRGLEDLTIVERNLEALGFINVSGLSAVTDYDQNGTVTRSKNAQSYHHIGLGMEYYPRREREWYSRFSLIGSINFQRLNSQGFQGGGSTQDVNEFAAGVNWHPGNMPSATLKFIPFFHLGFHIGNTRARLEPDGAGGDILTANGSTNGFMLGAGLKFYTPRGYGVRALFDYYQRNENFRVDNANGRATRTVAGPRLMLGISYRW
jgi:hypothetical protein